MSHSLFYYSLSYRLEGELVTNGQLEHLVLTVFIVSTHILLLHNVAQADVDTTVDVDGDGRNLIRHTDGIFAYMIAFLCIVYANSYLF